jgi:hypothetical protein
VLSVYFLESPPSLDALPERMKSSCLSTFEATAPTITPSNANASSEMKLQRDNLIRRLRFVRTRFRSALPRLLGVVVYETKVAIIIIRRIMPIKQLGAQRYSNFFPFNRVPRGLGLIDYHRTLPYIM